MTEQHENLIVREYLAASNAYYASTNGYVKTLPKYSDPITRRYAEAITALRELLGETIS